MRPLWTSPGGWEGLSCCSSTKQGETQESRAGAVQRYRSYWGHETSESNKSQRIGAWFCYLHDVKPLLLLLPALSCPHDLWQKQPTAFPGMKSSGTAAIQLSKQMERGVLYLEHVGILQVCFCRHKVLQCALSSLSWHSARATKPVHAK